MIDYLTAIFLGFVEGLTEFIPVSSTGHLVLLIEGLNFPKAFCGEVAAELARAFLGTITGETPSTLDSVQKAIAAQIALGGGAQNPGDHPDIPLGVEYTLNGAITPHRVKTRLRTAERAFLADLDRATLADIALPEARPQM